MRYQYLVSNRSPPGGHRYGDGQRRPLGLRGERGVGMSRDAGHEERDHVRLLLGPVSRHHLHGSAAEAELVLHL